jgi:hypothetical protein
VASELALGPRLAVSRSGRRVVLAYTLEGVLQTNGQALFAPALFGHQPAARVGVFDWPSGESRRSWEGNLEEADPLHDHVLISQDPGEVAEPTPQPELLDLSLDDATLRPADGCPHCRWTPQGLLRIDSPAEALWPLPPPPRSMRRAPRRPAHPLCPALTLAQEREGGALLLVGPGSERRRLAEGVASAAWTADGRWLVVVRRPDQRRERVELWRAGP